MDNKDNKNLLFEKKFGFDGWDDATKRSAFDFAEGYKKFLSFSKTEHLAVTWTENAAKENGYKELELIGETGQKGFKTPVYSINRGKAVILAKPGRRPAVDGLRLVLCHIDSPRLDLKMRPLFENEHIAFLKTQYYGGIKKYQWPTIPLAIYGTIAKQDGSTVQIALGDKPEDPIFMITDLLPHLDKLQAEKKLDEAIPAETLNVIVGNIAQKGKEQEKDLVKKNLLNLLYDQYGISEEDFVCADLEIVPAGAARDVGFDRSLVAGHGQDDRSCSYGALQAILNAKTTEFATVVVLVDKEDIGSIGVTSANSSFIADFISELIYLETGVHDENTLRDVFFRSKAISGDVTAGFDPDYPEVFDTLNSARVGAGVVIERYTGHGGKFYGNEASPELTSFIRNIFNAANVNWQSGDFGKIDIGGGSTISNFLSRLNMDVIDVGVALFSMHAPFEIASKADLYSTYLAYKAFFEAK